jgi:hypothetical protein
LDPRLAKLVGVPASWDAQEVGVKLAERYMEPAARPTTVAAQELVGFAAQALSREMRDGRVDFHGAAGAVADDVLRNRVAQTALGFGLVDAEELARWIDFDGSAIRPRVRAQIREIVFKLAWAILLDLQDAKVIRAVRPRG